MKATITDLERKRAQQALKEIQRWQNNKSSFKEAVTRLKGLPVTIRSEGLVTTLAILLKSNTSADENIADALARWLADGVPWTPIESNAQRAKTLMEELIHLENLQYRIVQREALAFVEHLKLLAEVWGNGAE